MFRLPSCHTKHSSESLCKAVSMMPVGPLYVGDGFGSEMSRLQYHRPVRTALNMNHAEKDKQGRPYPLACLTARRPSFISPLRITTPKRYHSTSHVWSTHSWPESKTFPSWSGTGPPSPRRPTRTPCCPISGTPSSSARPQTPACTGSATCP